MVDRQSLFQPSAGIVILIVILVALGGGGCGYWFLVVRKKGEGDKKEEGQMDGVATAKADP